MAKCGAIAHITKLAIRANVLCLILKSKSVKRRDNTANRPIIPTELFSFPKSVVKKVIKIIQKAKQKIFLRIIAAI